MKLLRTAPLALGFATWRFEADADALVLAVKATCRLVPDGTAEPIEPEDVLGDVFCGEEPELGACRYSSDVVPFKPKADLLLVGKVHTPGGRPLPRCSVTFGVGDTSATLQVTGDRYWLETTLGKASDPLPFTEMALGYEHAFGGPGWPANPAGKGQFGPDAQEAIQRPLPNVEDPSDLVRRPGDRPAPAGFGPLAPHWPHRMAKWPRITSSWVEERWPWPPSELDYSYFNAAQPALQVDGYLRGDEQIRCENLHPEHRRYRTGLPRLRPRCFVVDRADGAERFREVSLRLDTVWVDMEAEKLVLVWRGSVPVASEELDEVGYVYLASESLDDARLPPGRHRERFELARLEAEAPAAAPVPPAPGANDNAAPAPLPPVAQALPAVVPILPAALREQLARMGTPLDVLAALDAGDLGAATQLVLGRTGKTQAELDAVVAETRDKMKLSLSSQGIDPSLLDPPSPKPPPPPPPEPAAPVSDAWTRARVQAVLDGGGSLRELDLSGLDLSGLDFRERDLGGCILRAANLDGARFEGAQLAGANLSDTRAEGASFRKARLADADLTGVAAAGCDLEGADLEGALLTGAQLLGARMRGCQATAASFVRADLSDADLADARLSTARLDGARLDRVSLKNADLSSASAEGAQGERADFRGASLVGFRASSPITLLPGANLRGCQAERSRWMGADLSGADLGWATLVGADLSRTNLAGASLAGADCREADFTKARLSRAVLAGANLHAARMEGADLRRANLQGASLYQAQLWRARVEGADLEGAFTAGTLLESPVRDWAG